MVKRALLTFTFIAALSAASLGVGSKAMAWGGCHSDGGYRYSYSYPYSTYSVGYGGYAPRVAYYPAYPVRTYPVFYGRGYDGHRHHHDRHRHHNGLTVSFGF